jgi:hypothetical protein
MGKYTYKQKKKKKKRKQKRPANRCTRCNATSDPCCSEVFLSFSPSETLALSCADKNSYAPWFTAPWGTGGRGSLCRVRDESAVKLSCKTSDELIKLKGIQLPLCSKQFQF